MPTITGTDGSWTLTWADALPAPVTMAAPPAEPTSEAPAPDAAPSSSVTQADVQAALTKVPPKWTSTALRAGKTFLAGMAAAVAVAWATTGGTWEGLLRDPSAFLTALGTAVLMGAWKWLGWKEA